MISLKELERRMGFYIELDSKDLESFSFWCKENNLVCLVDHESYVLMKNGLATEVKGSIMHEALNGFWHYRFIDIREDRLIGFKNGIAYLEKFEIPEESTFLPYGLKGIVLPLLEHLSDINRLYKGINKKQEWKSPDIYYMGNKEESEQLEKHFGITELRNMEHSVQVFAKGENPEELREDYRQGKIVDGFHYWRYLKDEVKILAPADVLDSVIVKDIDVIMVRSLDPMATVYNKIRLNQDETEYFQICFHSLDFEKKMKILLDYLDIKEYYIVRTGNSWNEKKYWKLPENRPEEVEIDASKRGKLSHILYMILASYRHKYPFLNMISSGNFSFQLK